MGKGNTPETRMGMGFIETSISGLFPSTVNRCWEALEPATIEVIFKLCEFDIKELNRWEGVTEVARSYRINQDNSEVKLIEMEEDEICLTKKLSVL